MDLLVYFLLGVVAVIIAMIAGFWGELRRGLRRRGRRGRRRRRGRTTLQRRVDYLESELMSAEENLTALMEAVERLEAIALQVEPDVAPARALDARLDTHSDAHPDTRAVDALRASVDALQARLVAVERVPFATRGEAEDLRAGLASVRADVGRLQSATAALAEDAAGRGAALAGLTLRLDRVLDDVRPWEEGAAGTAAVGDPVEVPTEPALAPSRSAPHGDGWVPADPSPTDPAALGAARHEDAGAPATAGAPAPAAASPAIGGGAPDAAGTADGAWPGPLPQPVPEGDTPAPPAAAAGLAVASDRGVPVVAWRELGAWRVGLDLGRTTGTRPTGTRPTGAPATGARAAQDGSPLPAQDAENPVVELRDATPVTVAWDDGTIRGVELASAEAPYLVFRLAGERGTRLRALSTGAHLLLAWGAWRPGPGTTADVAPLGPARLRGFEAYLVHAEEGRAVTLVRGGQRRELLAAPTVPGLELTGRLVAPATDTLPDTFAALPALRAADASAVARLEVRELEEGPDAWCAAGVPEPDGAALPWPDGLADRRGGAYVVRLYDADDRALDALAFQFLDGLASVEVRGPSSPLLATGEGSGEASVEIVHEDAVDVTCRSPESVERIYVQRDGSRLSTRVVVADRPGSDRIAWDLQADERRLRLETRVDRVWWALSPTPPGDEAWSDRPVTVARDDFAEASEARLWLRLPAPRWADAVTAGFDDAATWREVPLPPGDAVVPVVLRAFADDPVLTRVGRHAFEVEVRDRGGGVARGALLELDVAGECTLCGAPVGTAEAQREHLHAAHLRALLRELEYEELRRRLDDPSLPARVFACPYRGQDGCHGLLTTKMHERDAAGQEQMWDHFQTRHPGRPHLFQPVRDAALVREGLGLELPHLAACPYCQGDGVPTFDLADEVDAERALDHLLEAHAGELFRLR